MYDLRIVVEEVKGFCDLPMRPGDYFELKGGRIIIPPGKFICMWALQSMIPLLPLKQRQITDENDWVPHTHRIVCPDPNGLVVYRIEQIGAEASDRALPPIPSRLLVNPDICTGCRACELACSLHHTGNFDLSMARLHVEKDELRGVDAPKACQQCGNAPCITACPQSAIGRDPESKALTLDRDKCIGCGLCVRACHFDALCLHPEERYPLTCDLCGGTPQCVSRCAIGALRFGRGEEQA